MNGNNETVVGWDSLQVAMKMVQKAPPSKEMLVEALQELVKVSLLVLGNEDYEAYLETVSKSVRDTWTPPNEPACSLEEMDKETIEKLEELKAACEGAVHMVEDVKEEGKDMLGLHGMIQRHGTKKVLEELRKVVVGRGFDGDEEEEGAKLLRSLDKAVTNAEGL